MGYRNHPATKEFLLCPNELYNRLELIRSEMLSRGYNPKELPQKPTQTIDDVYVEWEDLETQINKIKDKGCNCKLYGN